MIVPELQPAQIILMGWKDQDKKRVYQRSWVRNRRKYYIELRGGACERCGCTVDLEFHHTNPEIKVTHRIFSYSKEKIEKELSTCILLCRIPCHRIEQAKLKERKNANSIMVKPKIESLK